MLLKKVFWSIVPSLIFGRDWVGRTAVKTFFNDPMFDTPGAIAPGKLASWQNMVSCPNQGQITGIIQKIEQASTAGTDNTGLNGIKIVCDEKWKEPITVFEGKWGEWGETAVCLSFLTNFQIQFLPWIGGSWYHDQRFANKGRDPMDDVGITAITQFRCNHHMQFTNVDSPSKFKLAEEGGYYHFPSDLGDSNYGSTDKVGCGDWKTDQGEEGGHMCGLQVKNLPYQGKGGAALIDDAAIVGLKIKCCYWKKN